MMLIQALGSGAVGTAVAGGMSYNVAFRVLAVAVGVVVTSLFALYRAGRLPAGRTLGDSPT